MAPLSLPWTKKPLVINAPMGGFAGPALATAVTLAGGHGMIGADNNMDTLDTWLTEASSSLTRTDAGLLPIGVGLLVFVVKLDDAIKVLKKHRPAVVWLFAAHKVQDYVEFAGRIREAVEDVQVWVQVGNVEAAMNVAEEVRPDAICVQGADAGGHGYEKGAGVIAMVPEVGDALAAKGIDIPLLAAGGIAGGRGVAAALSLGAEGAVLGTRFLASEEVLVHPVYRQALLTAKDGGQATIRSKLFDNLRGPNIWPSAYNGRSLVMESFEEHSNGTEIEEIRNKHNEAIKAEDKGYGVGGKGRAAMWVGTGVGMVNKVQPAVEIVEEVRDAAKKALESARSRL